MTKGPIVTMRVDIASFGSGEYVFVVLQHGRKWVSLFHAASLHRIRVPLAEFERKASSVAMKPGNRRRFAARLRADIRDRRRWGISDGGQAAKAALSIIADKDKDAA